MDTILAGSGWIQPGSYRICQFNPIQMDDYKLGIKLHTWDLAISWLNIFINKIYFFIFCSHSIGCKWHLIDHPVCVKSRPALVVVVYIILGVFLIMPLAPAPVPINGGPNYNQYFVLGQNVMIKVLVLYNKTGQNWRCGFISHLVQS